MGEDVGKSVSVDKWGLPVSLQVTLPSMASGEPACEHVGSQSILYEFAYMYQILGLKRCQISC